MLIASPPARRCANIIERYLSDMEEILNDREVFHKLLDKILDSNGEENEAIFTMFSPSFPGGMAKQTTYRLYISAAKDVTYTEL